MLLLLLSALRGLRRDRFDTPVDTPVDPAVTDFINQAATEQAAQCTRRAARRAAQRAARYNKEEKTVPNREYKLRHHIGSEWLRLLCRSSS